MANESVLINGGIGDFLAVESFLPLSFKKNIKKAYYATNVHKIIKDLIDINPEYSKVEHFPLFEDENFLCFFSKEELKIALLKDRKLSKSQLKIFNDCYDLSIISMYQHCRTYTGCWYINNKLIDIKIDLPEKYLVVCPYSHHDESKTVRILTNKEWDFLFQKNIPLVVLGIDSCFVPENTINLMNKTNYLEAIEILKKSQGYFGVDSSISVVAAKIFFNNFKVKTTNNWCIKAKSIYYAPQKDFSFLVNNIE